MSEETTRQSGNEISLPKILREELSLIKPDFVQNGGGKPTENLNKVFDDLHKAELSALCFSGGGIRSATFGLGIVQALAKYRLLDNFDYLSTVSGGGYLGSWLSAWIRREQMNKFENCLESLKSIENKISERLNSKSLTASRKAQLETLQRTIVALSEKARLETLQGKIAVLSKAKTRKLHKQYNEMQDFGINAVQDELNKHSTAEPECPNTEPKQLQYLREYSNYMSPKVGLLSADTWTLLGIYVRNLFLNWTIFIPLICAVLLIPRILLELTEYKVGADGSTAMLMLGLVAGTFAVICTVRKLPSKKIEGGEIEFNTDAGVFATVITPLLIMALATTTFWVWINQPGQKPLASFNFLPPILKHNAIYFMLFSILIFVLGNLLFVIARAFFFAYERCRFNKRNFRTIAASIFSFAVLLEIASAAFSALVGGLMTWLIAYNFFDSKWLGDFANLPFYLCFAVPLYLISFSTGGAVFAGIYSKFASDADREWLARQGAWLLIVCGAWILLNGLVLFGPIGFAWLIESVKRLIFGGGSNFIDYVKDSIVPIIVAVSGFISLVGGFSGKSKVRDESGQSSLSKFLAVAPKIAAVIFLAFIFIGLAYVSGIALVAVGNSLETNRSAFGSYLHSDVLYQSSITYLFVWLVVLSVVGIGMACFVNVNKFSLHAAYRDRLIRAYLGASHVKRTGNPFTGFDDSDNFQLHRLKGQKPFHIINATLNLVAGNKLAWQNRKAASFTMSPLHCGSWLLGYRHSNEYCRNTNLPPCKHLRYCNQREKACDSVKNCQLPGKALRLGTAMTISGAAANPNMGYYSSPVVTFLMSLFNIRLGWWLGNTGKRGDDKDWFGWGSKEFYTKPSPSIAVLPLLNETLGQTDQDKHFLNITDGGHFENLGLYEMVLRRCKLIVLSDAADDENFTFGEISNAIEKCKVDLGVDIVFKDDINIYARDKAKDYAETRQLYAIAEIVYPERNHRGKNCKGHLLYIRPTFYGDESTDIKHYADSNKTFPHQSTADQLYDEKQFEAYRALGFCTVEKIMGSRQHNNLSDLMNILREDGIQKN